MPSTTRGLASAVPGMRVRFTGYFLRATGQTRGIDVWTVVACECWLCTDGGCCATDEFSPDGTYRRHIALANLEEVGKLPKVADMAESMPVDPAPSGRKSKRK